MTGRVAIVTGAAGGVGSAIADRLEADGLRVARIDIAGTDLLGPVDVTRPDEVDRACDHLERTLGPVDVVVNAAGTYGDRVPFLDSDADRWWRVVETNLRGPALLARRLVPSMVARGRGHLIDVGSRAAVWDDPGASSVAYSTSKAGLARFTAALAAELRGTGVVAVDLSPGMVRTGMTATRPDIDRIPDDRFLPLTQVAAVASAIVGGGYDELSGHFLHATDDLDALLAAVRSAPRTRTLSFIPHGGDDPVA